MILRCERRHEAAIRGKFDRYRGSGILPVKFAELPLAGEEPQRIVHPGGQRLVRFAAEALRFQPCPGRWRDEREADGNVRRKLDEGRDSFFDDICAHVQGSWTIAKARNGSPAAEALRSTSPNLDQSIVFWPCNDHDCV